MNSFDGVNEENFYELTNMFKVQMGNFKNKIGLLIMQILVGLILYIPMMQLRDMPDANILRAIWNISFGVYVILAIVAVGTMMALLMKKNVDILVNINGVLAVISMWYFLYLAIIVNIFHESYNYIFFIIAIITVIIPIVNGVLYYKKTKNKIIKGVYKKGNYKYNFNKKLLLVFIPILPMTVSMGNRGGIIEMVFGETYFLLGLNYFVLILSIIFSYFAINRIFFIHQLKLNKGGK